MADAHNVDVMRELRLKKRNVYKAVDEALKRSKLEEDYLEEGMEGLRTGVEPLLKEFDLCVNKHIETLEQTEGDNDEEIETWEMHVELVHIKWQKFLEIKRNEVND